MKQKGVYEAHELTKEHGYLGDTKKHLERGHVPGGRITGEGDGTSYTVNDEGGTIQRNKTFGEMKGRSNASRPNSHYGSSSNLLHNEAGVIPKGKGTKY